MSTLPPIDTPYMLNFLTRLLNIPSPTGYTEEAIAFVEQELAAFPLQISRTRKGALVARWQGLSGDAPRALTAQAQSDPHRRPDSERR